MQVIEGRGWFIFSVSALVSGDAEALGNRYLQREIGDGSISDYVEQKLQAVKEAGFARYSRKGWVTIQHPVLGMLQWKSGRDFRTTGRYFFFRVNGKEVLAIWPRRTDWWKTNPEQSYLV